MEFSTRQNGRSTSPNLQTMNNPGSGVDEAKWFAITLAIVEHETSGAEQRQLRAKALKGLVKAVSEQERLRGACRDTDLIAATRERDWLYSA